jgi:beta-glucosidase
MLGGWSVSWQGVYGGGQVCCAGPPDQIPPAVTVLKGLQKADPNVTYAPDQTTAVSDASSADAIVAVVGETPYAEGLGDNPEPQLPADQKSLISALEATGKPVIVVVLAGRPLGLGPKAESANALLMAYLPGTEGGNGVADVVFGKVDPSGKLPVTWPTDAPQATSGFNPGGPSPLGDEPKFLDQLAGTSFGWGSGYNPLYPFAYGLSYTTFKTSGLSVSGPSGGTVTAKFTVSNTGGRKGADVEPVFVNRPLDSNGVLTPAHRLVGFARVDLAAGQQQSVSVSFPISELAVTPGDIEGSAPPQVQPGDYQLQVGLEQPASSVSFTIH